jgi:hypothetical protein
MSDTPIDLNLTDKRSTRFPPFLTTRIEEFREEYNDTIRDIDSLDEDEQETFLLDSTSQAHRRLLDLGVAYWVENGAPFGYAFEPGDLAPNEDAALSCPDCDEDDPWLFRAAVGNTDDDGFEFGTIRCLACGHTTTRESFFTPSL